MYTEQEHVFYYVTVMNENYSHPPMPEGVETGILRGMYLFQAAQEHAAVQLMGCGAILREIIAASELLETDFSITSNIWSVPSFTELRRDGLSVERWNRLHPESTPRKGYVQTLLEGQTGPVIAASDYVKLFADQIRQFVPNNYIALGTDGFGRSDTRANLRHFFEVDRYHIVIATLKALADDGKIPMAKVSSAITQYNINPELPDPLHV